MANINPEAYKNAIKLANEYHEVQKKTKKVTEELTNLWDGISSKIFGVSGAQWFDKVPKTTEDIAKQVEQLNQMSEAVRDLSVIVNEKLGKAFENIISEDDVEKIYSTISKSQTAFTEKISETLTGLGKEIPITELEKLSNILQKDIEKPFGEFLKDNEKLKKLRDKNLITEKDMQEVFKEVKELDKERKKIYDEIPAQLQFINALSSDYEKQQAINNLLNKDFAALTEQLGENAAEILETTTLLGEEEISVVKSLISAKKAQSDLKKQVQETEKPVFNIAKGFEQIAKNIARQAIPILLQFDETIHQLQRTTSANFEDSASRMTDLARGSSRLGMTLEDNAELMGEMADELRTVQTDDLIGAAENFQAIKMATGASVKDIAEIGSELMKIGYSAEQAKDYMVDINVQAGLFGVSSRRMMEGIARNLKLMKEFGFSGGEESLIKMTAQAERLRINIDSVFDIAKRARQIDSAIEMAAELQLAGGSFANIDPMQLLAAARTSPQELMKLLTKMGDDIGHWAEDAEGKMKFAFGPVDKDRLQIVADSLGISLGEMMEMTRKNAEDARKMDMMPSMTFKGMTDEAGKPIDEDAMKSMILDQVDVEGVVKEGSLLDKAGLDSLGQLTQEQALAIYKQIQEEEKAIEERAKANMSLRETFKGFTDSFLYALTVFEPVLKVLTKVLQFVGDIFNKVMDATGEWGKWILGFVIATAAFGGHVLKFGAFITKGFARNLGILRNIFKPQAWKNIGQSIAGAFRGGLPKGGAPVASTAPVGGFGGLAGLQKGAAKVVGGIGNIFTNIFKVLSKIGKGIVDVITSIAKAVGKTFVTIMRAAGRGLAAFFTALMSAAPAIPIAYAFTPVIIGLAFALKLLGQALGAAAPFIEAFFTGIGAVIESVGVAIATVITAIADSIVKLGDIDPLRILALAGSITALSIALAAFGGGSIIAGIGSAIGKFFGGDIFDKLARIAMLAEPLNIVGMAMKDFSQGMVIADKAMSSFAASVEKLKDALAELSMDKLEKLKEISKQFAEATANTTVTSALADFANALRGGGGAAGAGGTQKPIVVQLTLPNGRVLSETIIRDTNAYDL